MDYKIEEFHIKNYRDIRKIYLDAFSKENRFSLPVLFANIILKRANIHIVIAENEVVAFIYSIHHKNEKFILYLATKESYRNRGIGTYLLNWFLEK